MPTVTKSIGSSGRDYSTITLWEADLDNGAVYASGDIACGEIYKDSVFSERPTVNGGGTVGLSAIKLTVPTSQRHTGIAGTGAILKPGGNGVGFSSEGSIAFTLEWLELNGDAASRSISQSVTHNNFTSNTNPFIFQHLLIHNSGTAFGEAVGIGIVASAQGVVSILNNIVYDITSTQVSATTDAVAIRSTTATRARHILNNTVHDIVKNGGSSTADAYGIQIVDDADYTVKNNIVTDAGGTTTGTKGCFTPTSFSLATVGWNLSSDTTASGTGALVSKTAANQFVSTTVGAEDLHLKAGADAIDAGTDLGTTPTGVNYDIDNRDRDALGDVWDIGADEYVVDLYTSHLPDVILPRRFAERGDMLRVTLTPPFEQLAIFAEQLPDTLPAWTRTPLSRGDLPQLREAYVPSIETAAQRLRSRTLLFNGRPFEGEGHSLYVNAGDEVQYRALKLVPRRWIKGTGDSLDLSAASVPKTPRVASAASPASSIEYALPAALASQSIAVDVRHYKDDVECEVENFRQRTAELDAGLEPVAEIRGTAAVLEVVKLSGGDVRLRFLYSPSRDGTQPYLFRAMRTAGPTSPAAVTTRYHAAQRYYTLTIPGLSDAGEYTYKIRAENQAGSITADVLTGIIFLADASGPPKPLDVSAEVW